MAPRKYENVSRDALGHIISRKPAIMNSIDSIIDRFIYLFILFTISFILSYFIITNFGNITTTFFKICLYFRAIFLKLDVSY